MIRRQGRAFLPAALPFFPMKPERTALTGGIATGKSTVASMFEALGAVIIDADKAAREVIRPGTSCWEKLHELLGNGYFGSDGALERRKLRERILRDDTCRSRVNAILHPSIMTAMEEEWEASIASHPNQPVLFDIPLLYETNLTHRFERIILVYTPPETQVRRLMARDDLNREEAEKTLEIQLPIDHKRRMAHIVIDNSGGLEQTRRQVEAIWKALCLSARSD